MIIQTSKATGSERGSEKQDVYLTQTHISLIQRSLLLLTQYGAAISLSGFSSAFWLCVCVCVSTSITRKGLMVSALICVGTLEQHEVVWIKCISLR